MLPALLAHFADLEDPRVERTRLHSLTDIVGIALCGVICGADSWVEIEAYGNAKQDWLSQWLALPNGIPSHDTFARLFARLKPQALSGCLYQLSQALATRREKLIAFDGKYLRHSFDTAHHQSALVMLNAWASCQRLALASVPVDLKSNEIKAIPELLALLEIAGCIVTCDAMGCQKTIARQILEQEGEYVLGLKGNQPETHQETKALFAWAQERAFADLEHDFYEQTDYGHGRLEVRRCWVTSDIAWLDPKREWAGLQTLALVEAQRQVGDQISVERRYYLSSLPANAKRLLWATRAHWGLENSVHWVLDIAFDEDRCRIRKDHAPANFSLLRQMALNLLRQEKTCKNGIKVKRSKAGWDNAYLFKVLDSCSQL
jgi:predicted transposase YbfD/YdcC